MEHTFLPHFWSNYHKQKKEAPWRKWLDEYVYIDVRNPRSVVKRFECFQYFCRHGLIPFVKRHGYNFDTKRNLANDIANYIFQDMKQDFILQEYRRYLSAKDENDIDYDYYCLKGIPVNDWDAFWNEWQWMSDFYDEKFRNRYSIPYIVYNRLDLEHSSITQKINQELDEAEDEDDYIHPTNEQASEAIGQGKDKNSLY